MLQGEFRSLPSDAYVAATLALFLAIASVVFFVKSATAADTSAAGGSPLNSNGNGNCNVTGSGNKVDCAPKTKPQPVGGVQENGTHNGNNCGAGANCQTFMLPPRLAPRPIEIRTPSDLKCPQGYQLAPAGAAVVNDHSKIGTQINHGDAAYNFCTLINKQENYGVSTVPAATPGAIQPISVSPEVWLDKDLKLHAENYVMPLTAADGTPCRAYIDYHIEVGNVAIGVADPFGVPPGSCVILQVVSGNVGYIPNDTNDSVTRQEVGGH